MVVLSFESYKTMSIYIYDYNHSHSRSYGRIKMNEMGFNSENPPIQIKFLSNDTVDIVNIGGKFISDIELTLQQKAYIANIDLNKVPLDQWDDKVEKLDYELDKYWALTSKMRNYDVGFKYASNLNEKNDSWVKILNNDDDDDYRYYEELEEEEESESDPEDPKWEPAEDEHTDEDEYEYLTPNTTTDDLSEDNAQQDSSDNDNTDSHEGFLELLNKLVVEPIKPQFNIKTMGDKVIARSDIPVLPTEMFKAVMISPYLEYDECDTMYKGNPVYGYNLIVIEYGSEKCNYLVKTEIGKIKMIEMFLSDHEGLDDQFTESVSGERVESLIIIDSIHCNGVDLCLHSDDGVYESGVNFYKRDDTTVGIVFCGKQNSDEVNNYAMCLYYTKIIPDILMTDEAAANMNNYSVPKSEHDEKYWYNYEAQSYETVRKAEKKARELRKLMLSSTKSTNC